MNKLSVLIEQLHEQETSYLNILMHIMVMTLLAHHSTSFNCLLPILQADETQLQLPKEEEEGEEEEEEEEDEEEEEEGRSSDSGDDSLSLQAEMVCSYVHCV